MLEDEGKFKDVAALQTLERHCTQVATEQTRKVGCCCVAVDALDMAL